jgi:hypothetical protein
MRDAALQSYLHIGCERVLVPTYMVAINCLLDMMARRAADADADDAAMFGAAIKGAKKYTVAQQLTISPW